jgi:hypothetical protein
VCVCVSGCASPRTGMHSRSQLHLCHGSRMEQPCHSEDTNNYSIPSLRHTRTCALSMACVLCSSSSSLSFSICSASAAISSTFQRMNDKHTTEAEILILARKARHRGNKYARKAGNQGVGDGSRTGKESNNARREGRWLSWQYHKQRRHFVAPCS